MRKYLLIMSLGLFNVHLSAQKMYVFAIDSIRIHELKQQLTKAKDKGRVDVLNKLAGEFQNAIASTDSIHRDSVYKYASLANKESKTLNYEYGIAYSLYRLSRYYMKYLKNRDLSKESAEQALALAQKINSAEILGWCYYDKWELKKAYDYFRIANDKEAEADVAAWLCYEYSQSGKYDEEGFKYCQRAMELANIKKINTPSWGAYISSFTYETLSDMYKEVGDYDAALNYLKQTDKYAKQRNEDMDWSFGRLFMHIGKYDSSVLCFERALKKDPENRFLVKHVGSANLLTKNYSRAAELFEKAIAIMQKPEFAKRKFPINWKGELHLELAEAYTGLNKTDLAAENYQAAVISHRQAYNELIVLFDEKKLGYEKIYDLMRISEGYSKSLSALGSYDSAYFYLTKHNQFKDSVQNRNLLWRLNMQLGNYKKKSEEERKTSQINLLNKDNQLKEQKLKQQATLRNSLLIGLVLFLLLGVFIFRNQLLKRKNDKLRMQKDFELQRLESEKKQAELHQKAIELEMQALRAQMNPHFIFNCLSSINRFIFKNDNKTASDYLTRFSRLIRMVLMHSQKKLIPLEDELEMIRLYLDLERLRFKDAFDYSITTTNIVDAGNIFIPPLLLQPFCENAVWHGLMHKETKGHLNIVISEVEGENEKTLHCIIEDDGVGRDKAAEMKSKSAGKEKSLGLKITTERIALLNKENNFNTFYKIDDIMNDEHEVAGTRVQLKIKYKEAVEETV